MERPNLLKNIKNLKWAAISMTEIRFNSVELEDIAEKVAREIVNRDLNRISAKLKEIETLIILLRRFMNVALERDSTINRKLDEIRGVILLVEE